MPRVAQKLQPASALIGSITTRLRNVEAQLANNDMESAQEDFYLIERKIRMLKKHVNPDLQDDEDEAETKPNRPIRKSA